MSYSLADTEQLASAEQLAASWRDGNRKYVLSQIKNRFGRYCREGGTPFGACGTVLRLVDAIRFELGDSVDRALFDSFIDNALR